MYFVKNRTVKYNRFINSLVPRSSRAHRRRAVLERIADRAEFELPQDRLGGILTQLRRRGYAAEDRARWLWRLLLFVLILGVSFYIIKPLIDDFVSVTGNKRSLARQQSSLAAQTLGLDQDRAELYRNTIAAIQPGALRIHDAVRTFNVTAAVKNSGSNIILVGKSGTLGAVSLETRTYSPRDRLRIDADDIVRNVISASEDLAFIGTEKGSVFAVSDGGTFVQKLDVPGFNEEEWLDRVIARNDHIVVLGDEGYLGTYKHDNRILTELKPTSSFERSINRKWFVVGDRLISNDTSGKIWSLHQDSLEFTMLNSGGMSVSERVVNVVPIGENDVLILGDRGYAKRHSFDAQNSPTDFPIPNGLDASSPNVTKIAKSFHIFWGPQNFIYIWDDVAKMFERFDLEGASPSEFVARVDVINDGQAIISGDEGYIGVLKVDLDSRQLMDPPNFNFSEGESIIALRPLSKDRFLVGSNRTSLFEWNLNENEVTEFEGLEFKETENLSQTYILNETYTVVQGDQGTVQVYDTKKGQILNSALWQENFTRVLLTIPGETTAYMVSEMGVIVRIGEGTKIHTHKFTEDTLTKDSDLETFLQGILGEEEHKNNPSLIELLGKINFLIAQRALLEGQLANLEVERKNIDFFKVTQEREIFTAFMSNCRDGVPVPPPVDDRGEAEALTLACLKGWEDTLNRDRQSWWLTLAEQVPPGILLLFLLATLSGLYRYNLRLAGFHHSRADVLELQIAKGSDFTPDQLAKISDAFAADKVEFGKNTMPSDQAVSMANTLLGRVNKSNGG